MSRTRLLGRTRFGAAAYLALAVLFALRCSVAWAAADLPAAAAESAHASPLAANSHVAALAALKPPPGRCEATNDDPPPPCLVRTSLLRWSTPVAPPTRLPTSVATGAPAPPPPARGPPVQAA
jgi:hypothetical protein